MTSLVHPDMLSSSAVYGLTEPLVTYAASLHTQARVAVWRHFAVARQ